MWWVGDRGLDIFVGSRRLMSGVVGGRVHTLDTTSFEDTCRGMTSGLSLGRLNSRARVWLSGDLCRPVLIQQAAALGSDANRDAAMQGVARKTMGTEDRCRLWWRRSTSEDQLIGATVLETTARQIESILIAAGFRVVSIAPYWSQALRAAIDLCGAELRAVLVSDGESITGLTGARGSFAHVFTIAPLASADAARSALARAHMTLDLEPTAKLIEIQLGSATLPTAAAANLPFGIVASLVEVSG